MRMQAIGIAGEDPRTGRGFRRSEGDEADLDAARLRQVISPGDAEGMLLGSVAVCVCVCCCVCG